MTREPISLEVMAERLANFMSEERITRNQEREERKFLLAEVTGLKLAVQKQNGSVATVLAWQTSHNAHHGINDEAIGKRLKVVEDGEHDDQVRRDVWKSQLAMFGGGSGFMGLVGIAAKLLGYL